MKYFLIDSLSQMAIVVAEEMVESTEDEAEFSKVLLTIIANNERAIFNGSEKFLVYSEGEDISVEQIGFTKLLKWINTLSRQVYDRQQAVRAFFEPNPDGNQ